MKLIPFLLFLSVSALGAEVKPNNAFKGTIINVYDGDTMDVSLTPLLAGKGFGIHIERRLRLARINAPEMKDPSLEVQKKAIKARDFARAMVLGKEVVVILGRPDSYERNVSEVYYIENKLQFNLSDELLKRGLVVPYVGK